MVNPEEMFALVKNVIPNPLVMLYDKCKGGKYVESQIVTDERFKEILEKDFITLADTTTTSWAGAIPVKVSKKAIEVAIAKRTARKIFPVDQSLVGQAGATLRFPKLSRITFSDWTEGGTIPETQVTATGIDITPEWFAGGVKATYETIETSAIAVINRLGQLLGNDYAVYEDKKVYSSLVAGATSGHIVDKTSNGWDDATAGETNMRNDIVEALKMIEEDYFNATHIIMNTELAQYLRKAQSIGYAMYYGQSIHTEKRDQLTEAGLPEYLFGARVVTTPNLLDGSNNTDIFVVVDADNVGLIVDKVPFTTKQMDRPDQLEVWIFGYGAMKFGVLQGNAVAGKTDCVNPA